MKSYTIDKDLGQGTFSKVKLGIHKLTGEKVAIKIIDKTRQQEQDYVRIHREIQILRKLRHPNVIQLFEIVDSDSKLFLVTEYANGGELFDHIVQNKRLDEREAAKLFIQLINAVQYIHEQQIVHRDLKPENVLLNDGIIKVIDFGLSSMYQIGEKLKTPCGSPCYAAPEMLQGLQYNGLFTDIWSSGIILYAMICGCVPFEDQNTKRLYEKIKTADFHLPRYVSVQAGDLLKKLLMKDPTQRITLDGIRSHDFIKFAGKFSIPPQLKIDQSIITQVINLGISNNQEITDMIKQNRHNQITTTYYLLLNKQIRYQQHFSTTSQQLSQITQQLTTQIDKQQLNETTPYIFKIKAKNQSPFKQDTSQGTNQSPRRNVSNITIIKKIRANTRSQEPIQKRDPSVTDSQPLAKQTRQITKGQLSELFKKVSSEVEQQKKEKYNGFQQNLSKHVITERVSTYNNNTSLLKIPTRQGRLSFKCDQKTIQTQPAEKQKKKSNDAQRKLMQMDSIAMNIQSNIQNRFLIYKKKK